MRVVDVYALIACGGQVKFECVDIVSSLDRYRNSKNLKL
jgi:hypothetical protein